MNYFQADLIKEAIDIGEALKQDYDTRQELKLAYLEEMKWAD